jgi:hypothetical protein
MFTNIQPHSFFSVVGAAYVPERHFDTAHHDTENRRRRKESLSVLAGLPCIGRGDYLPEPR